MEATPQLLQTEGYRVTSLEYRGTRLYRWRCGAEAGGAHAEEERAWEEAAQHYGRASRKPADGFLYP